MTTGELSAALARGGRVEIPPGVHEVTDTLVVGPGVTHLVGPGRERCVLLWKGPSDRAVVHVDRGVWNADLGGFHIRNGGSPRTGVGLAAFRREQPAAYTGTECGSNRYDSIGVEGFAVGVKLGDSGYTATSENRFVRLAAYHCTQGVLLTDYNTLNNHFTDLNLSGCRVGLTCRHGGGETRIHGGSASLVTGSVFDLVSGGNYSIRDYRQGEGGGGRFLGCGQPVQVEVTSCVIDGTGKTVNGVYVPIDYPVEVYYDSQVTITNTLIDGRVITNYLSGSVTLTNCQTRKPVSRIVEVRNPAAGRAYRVEERGCVTCATGRMVRLADYVTDFRGA